MATYNTAMQAQRWATELIRHPGGFLPLKTGGDTTGRNCKVALDWWPRDIGLFRDPKLRSVRQEFGVLGPYIYECLLDIAYGAGGYYI